MEEKENILNEFITDEYILYKHNYLKDKIELALDIVRNYIIKNNLLIVGGTAIDFALRLNNNKLYNELYQVPDFDIISPDNIQHANNIGNILCKNNLDNISIIPAIHHTTVRVQLLGFTLFDATYVPIDIYNKIPFLIYKEFKFVDPNFQKLNQYLSMSFLFKITGPSYNILHRLDKDIKRHKLLSKYYSININKSILENINKPVSNINLHNIIDFNKIIINKITFIDNHKIIKYDNPEYDIINKYIYNSNISFNIDSNLCIHGILAYNLIYKDYHKIYNMLISNTNIEKKDIDYINQLNKDILNNINTLTDLEICLLNNNNKIEIIEDLLSIINTKKINNTLDLIPKHIYGQYNNLNCSIYDLYGDLISINLININNKYIPISSISYNLLYFLSKYYLESDDYKKNMYLIYYNSLNNILSTINLIYENYNLIYNDLFNNKINIYNISINTMGIINYPENYYYYLINFNNLINTNQNLKILPNKQYLSYPDCKINSVFNKENSIFYSNPNSIIQFTNYANEIKKLNE